MDLTKEQMDELEQFLGCPASEKGRWGIVKECSPSTTPVAVNDRGTMVIALKGYSNGSKRRRFLNTRSLHPHLTKNGYVEYHNVPIHRMVAEAFLDTWDPSLQVNHIDGNKQNNDVNNLEMTTPKENTQHYMTSDCFENSRELRSKKLSESLKGHKSYERKPEHLVRKPHTEETKQKISETRKRKYQNGELPSPATCTGRIHITNGKEEKVIFPEQLELFSDEWHRGRLKKS